MKTMKTMKSMKRSENKYTEDHMNVMLDLETFSVKSNAAIISIAAIKFKRDDMWNERITKNNINCHDNFYTRIEIDSCKELGMHIDPKTVEWWNSQETNIKYEALVNPNRFYIREALENFTKWLGTDSDNIRIWGNGPSFDCTILKEAYNSCNMDVPWKYYNERDLRTVMELGNVKLYQLPQNEKHNPLFDVYRQVLALQKAERNLYMLK